MGAGTRRNNDELVCCCMNYRWYCVDTSMCNTIVAKDVEQHINNYAD